MKKSVRYAILLTKSDHKLLDATVDHYRVKKGDVLTGLIWEAIKKQSIGDESVKIKATETTQTTLRLCPYMANRFNKLRAKANLSSSKAISLMLISSDKIYLDQESYVIEFKNYPNINSQ